MMKLKQKNIYIGIDIGTSSIKVVEVEIGLMGEPTLKKASIVAKSEGLKKAILGMRLKGAKVIGIVDCPKTCVRQLTIPVMSEREIIEAIKWEAKDKIPVSLDESIVSYKVQEELVEGGVKKFRVTVAASPIPTVNNVINVLNEAGIEPISLIDPSIAFEHLSRYLSLKVDGAVAFIDIGCEIMQICIIKENTLKFHRKVSFGGSAITKAIMGAVVSDTGRVELDEATAEKIKTEYGISAKEGGPDLIEGKISATQIKSLIRPTIERLLNEIERSLEYYRQESAGERVTSVVLFGGSAQLKGLAEFLQENLGVDVTLCNPFSGMNMVRGAVENLETVSHRFGFALGAALSEGKGINLLPKELKEKTKRTFERAGIEGFATAVVVILILILIGMRIQLANYNKKINSGNLELKATLPQVEIALNYVKIQDEISERKALINGILNNTPLWKDVFKELSNIVPKEVVLTEMRMDNNVLFIKGEILGTSQNREKTLSNFISALESTMFKRISLLTAKIGEEEKAKSEFEIKCVYSTE